MRPGQIERRTHGYTRHGVTELLAARNMATGQIVRLLMGSIDFKPGDRDLG